MTAIRKRQRQIAILKAIPFSQTVARVVELTGIPERTVMRYFANDEELAVLRAEQDKLLVQEANQKALESVRAIKSDKFKSNMEAATNFGILVDKMRALEGKDTKWSANQLNIGDNRQIIIKVSDKIARVLKNNSK